MQRVYQEIKNKNKPHSNITKEYCKLTLKKDFLESRTVTQKNANLTMQIKQTT